MSVSKYERTQHYDETYVRGNDVRELLSAVERFLDEARKVESGAPQATWRTEDGALVLSYPTHSSMVGGRD